MSDIARRMYDGLSTPAGRQYMKELDELFSRPPAIEPRGLVPGKPHVQRYRGRWCAMPVRNVPYPCEFGDSPLEAFARFSARYAVLVFG